MGFCGAGRWLQARGSLRQARGPKFRQLAPMSDTAGVCDLSTGEEAAGGPLAICGPVSQVTGKLQVQIFLNKVIMQLKDSCPCPEAPHTLAQPHTSLTHTPASHTPAPTWAMKKHWCVRVPGRSVNHHGLARRTC